MENHETQEPTQPENATEGKADSPGVNGGKVRSETAYPYFGLQRGLDIVDAVRRAGGSEASNADVMRELGVSKVTERLWAYGVPAAIQFGLIERVGRGEDGRLKLTDLASRISLPGTPEEARIAKVVAFRTPELYAKLVDKFAGHPVPSKEGLKNILQREYKIVESMAPIAADAFLDSLKAAELVTQGNAIMTGTDGPTAKPEMSLPQGVTLVPPGVPLQGDDRQMIFVPANFIVYKCKIRKGFVIEVPLPPDFTSADVHRLHAFLLTQVDDPETP